MIHVVVILLEARTHPIYEFRVYADKTSIFILKTSENEDEVFDMGFMDALERNARKMTLTDMMLLKVVSAFFGIIIGTYFAADLKNHIVVIIAIFVVLGAISLYRFWMPRK